MLTNTTELEAVNTVLSTIGEAPLNDLEEPAATVGDHRLAITTLTEVSREVQQKGWFFNRERDYLLTPEATTHEIVVPANAANIDLDSAEYPDIDPILRGTKVYDRKAHSYTFTKAFKADIIFYLEFDLLPEVARRLITLRAGRLFQDRAVGSPSLHELNKLDEFKAELELKYAEAEAEDRTIFDSMQARSILSRSVISR